MFLDENTVTTTAVSADPMYGAQLIQEASEEWNELCMKMIKLEHTAIVSEDANLLEAGIKDFAKKAEAHIKLAAQKFIEYLERVRVEWTKIQAAVMSKFVNADVINAVLAKLKNDKVKMQMDKTKWDANMKVLETWSKAASWNNFVLGQNKSQLEKGAAAEKNIFASADNTTEVVVDQTLVKQAVSFLKNRAVAVKNLQAVKANYAKEANEEIKKMKSANRKMETKSNLVVLQRYINGQIIALNKCTSIAIKICNAVKVKNSGVSKTALKNAKKDVKKQNGLYTESVLDQF